MGGGEGRGGMSVAGDAKGFQPPIAVGQGCEKSCDEHGRYAPPYQSGFSDQQEVRYIHGGFHGDHGDERHFDGGLESQHQG